jgi:hypothetical protein
MKKLLLLTFLVFTTFCFSQQSDKNNTVIKRSETPITLKSVTASPNPFSTKTTINFQSTKSQLIVFTLKNLLGKTVYSEQISASTGQNIINFEKNDISKGMYIYTLQTGSEVISKRLVIQ